MFQFKKVKKMLDRGITDYAPGDTNPSDATGVGYRTLKKMSFFHLSTYGNPRHNIHSVYIHFFMLFVVSSLGKSSAAEFSAANRRLSISLLYHASRGNQEKRRQSFTVF